MKIAIVATFREDDSAYSLCNVVNEQLHMLVSNGYKPVVLVTEGFKPGRMFADPDVELRFLPDQNRYNEVKVDDTFNDDVEKLADAMVDKLHDIDIVLTHDIIYQPDAIKHNLALRYAHGHALPNLHFLHWIHSATTPYKLSALRGEFKEKYRDVVTNTFPHSYYIFMNEWSRPRIAREFDVPEYLVKIVHHATDYYKFAKYDQYTIDLINEKRLLDADYVDIYPIRLDRGKQAECVIKLMGSLKKLNFSVRFICVDFASTSDDPQDPKFQYRQFLKDTAIDWGLNEQDVTFTSEFKPESKYSVPTGVVADLFDFSNIFVMPSMSESYSLITQEAAMKGNLLILNRSFPPFRELFGPEAIHWPFNSAVAIADIADGETRINYPYPDGEKEDFLKLAKEVVANTLNKQNSVRRRLLRQRLPREVFIKQLEPLFSQIKEQKTW